MKIRTQTQDHEAALIRDGFAWRAGDTLWMQGEKPPGRLARLWKKLKGKWTMARLEHVNFTAHDSKATAELLCRLFDWKIRWQGKALNGGHTVHVGSDDDYLAIYTPLEKTEVAADSYHIHGGLNHIGVVVDDLDATEARVKAAGFKPHLHADYEPGKRFYFDGPDGVEYEVVSYA